MKIFGFISLAIGILAAIGIFLLHQKDEDDMARICVWVSAIFLILGIVLLLLPGVLHPAKSALSFLNYKI